MFLVVTEHGDDKVQTLSFSRAPTILVTFAGNRFTRLAARFYQEQFGIGVMDMRMLVMLTRAPGCSVAKASETIGIDKAAVSRSLTRLEKSGLAEAISAENDERRKSWSLTTSGRALHDRILVSALARQRKLLKGFTREEVENFTGLLGRFLDNIETLRDDAE
jgi:DNA-binding MarR family transcriptional regulator